MRLLYRIIKPSQYEEIGENKKIVFTQIVDMNKNILEDNVEQTNNFNKEIGEKIINEAENKAKKIIEEAEYTIKLLYLETENKIKDLWLKVDEDKKKIFEDAKENGYKEGYSKGLELAKKEVMEEYQEKILQANNLLTNAYQEKEKIINEAEPFIIELSLEIAKKIINKTIEQDNHFVLNIVKNALTKVHQFGLINIYVSPDYYGILINARENLLQNKLGIREIRIIPDSSINDAGCVIESEFGTVDATVTTQLEEIKNAINELLLGHDENVIN